MSNLSAPTANDVAVVLAIEIIEAPAAETVIAGYYGRLSTAGGKIEYGNDSSTAEARPGGIILKSAIAGETTSLLRKGVVDLGDILGGLTYDDIVYLSATDGRLADASVSEGRIVGSVVPGWAQGTADKLLRVDL